MKPFLNISVLRSKPHSKVSQTTVLYVALEPHPRSCTNTFLSLYLTDDHMTHVQYIDLHTMVLAGRMF